MKAKQTQNLQLLVAELIKKDLNRERIKQLASQSGLTYFEDPIQMMSLVLRSIDQMPVQKLKRKMPETSPESP